MSVVRRHWTEQPYKWLVIGVEGVFQFDDREIQAPQGGDRDGEQQVTNFQRGLAWWL